MTFHGFRYVEVTGLAKPPALEDVTGVVIHSDLAAHRLVRVFAPADE